MFKNYISLFINTEHPILNQPQYRKIETLINRNIGILIFEFVTYSIYYHEESHLLQFSKSDIYSELDEYSAKDSKYDLRKHLWEFDADINSIFKVANHIIIAFDKFPLEEQTIENLESLISLVFGGVLVTHYMRALEAKLYFNETTHPHSLIRILYSSQQLFETFNFNNFNLNEAHIIEESICLAKELLSKTDNKYWIEQTEVLSNKKQIDSYIKFLKKKSYNYEELIMNSKIN